MCIRDRVTASPEVAAERLVPGAEVRVNDALAVVEVVDAEQLGSVVTVHECLEGGRVVVNVNDAEQRAVLRAEDLRGVTLRQGDTVLYAARGGFLHEIIPRAAVEDLILEEVPDITSEDIGGLAGQIEQIRDAVELPYLHPELFLSLIHI